MRGHFLTIEGGEGVGKSTFTKLFSQWLTTTLHGRLTVTREPGGTDIADTIRQIFVHPPKHEKLCVEAELCLVSAARAQHVKNLIAPQLNQGYWVICDRFADSTRVYQGVIGGIDTQQLEAVIQLTTFDCEPDLTFLLDCSVDVSLSRLQQRSHQEQLSRFDGKTKVFHERLRKAYLSLAQKFPHRILVLNADQPAEDIVKEAQQAIQARGWLS